MKWSQFCPQWYKTTVNPFWASSNYPRYMRHSAPRGSCYNKKSKKDFFFKERKKYPNNFIEQHYSEKGLNLRFSILLFKVMVISKLVCVK